MGGGSWTSRDYSHYTSTHARSSMSTQEVFTSRHMKDQYDPKKIQRRESRDSKEHPNSNSVIIGLDVTGSMGYIATHMAKTALGTVMGTLLEQKILPDPQLMFMAVGDHRSDRAPLQVTQFESDIRIAHQLSDLYIEGGGGGNCCESYDLPWAFGIAKVSMDCFEKRQRKGYIFTIGDECAVPGDDIIPGSVIGTNESPLVRDALAQARLMYHVFHIIVEEGDYARSNLQGVNASWMKTLGCNAINLRDHRYVSEVLVSVINRCEGMDPEDCVLQWEDQKVQGEVRYAMESMKNREKAKKHQ